MSNPEQIGDFGELVRGDRVVALMWPRRISQTQLAAEIGVNRSLLSLKLRGQRQWYLREVTELAKALNTTVAYLIGESDEVRPTSAATDQVGRTGLEPVTDGL